MTRSTQLILVIVAVVVLAATASALAVMATQDSHTTLTGPSMMRGYRGMMGGGIPPLTSQARPSSDQLGAVRDQVDRWLGANSFTGFRVSEVMAFTNNDYVAVHDSQGHPAFELLVAPRSGWLMEEPPSMMWNTRYGMMGGGGRYGVMGGGGMMSGNWNGTARSGNGWNGTGYGRVPTISRAVTVADRWLAQARPGEHVDAEVGGMGGFPGYYTLDTMQGGQTVGMLSVNAATGAIWYHTWHGRFLAEREF